MAKILGLGYIFVNFRHTLSRGTWLVSLKQKFRDTRRPMVSDERVKAMKRKYEFKTYHSQSSSSKELQPQPPKKNSVVHFFFFLW